MKCPYCGGELIFVCNGKDSYGKFKLLKCKKCYEVIKTRKGV